MLVTIASKGTSARKKKLGHKLGRTSLCKREKLIKKKRMNRKSRIGGGGISTLPKPWHLKKCGK